MLRWGPVGLWGHMEIVEALSIAFTVEGLLLILAGCVLAMLMGMLPGLSGTEALLIVLPFTFHLGLNESMLILCSAYASSYVGGALTSIVFGIPGSSTNLATIIDGYPLHKQGRTIFAVNVAFIASAIGGLISIGLLVALIPFMEPVSLLFGPPEWFLIVIFGLVVLAFSSESSFLRVLISGAFGLLLATVGMSVIGGTQRYTMGLTDLWGGIPIIASFIGLYPLAEAVDLARTEWKKNEDGAEAREVLEGLKRKGQLREAAAAVARNPYPLGVGTFTGWFVGLVPGVGASLASILGYLVVKQVSPNQDSFGKGDVRGVIGAETANNATVGGALIPALALGIPGSVNTAVLLGVMMINGVQPGTNVFTSDLTLLWTILVAVTLSTVLASTIMILGGWRLVAGIARVPPRSTVPAIAMIACMSLLLARGNPFDLSVAIVMAAIGIVLKKYRFSRVAFIIALLLGPLVEQSYLQALSISRGSYLVFFESWVAIVLWAVIALCVGVHVRNVARAWRGRHAGATVAQGAGR